MACLPFVLCIDVTCRDVLRVCTAQGDTHLLRTCGKVRQCDLS